MQSNFTFQWQFEHIHKHTQKEKKMVQNNHETNENFFFLCHFKLVLTTKPK